MKSAAWGFKILRSLVGWIVEVVRASSRSRQKVWSPVVLQQVKEKKAGIPVWKCWSELRRRHCENVGLKMLGWSVGVSKSSSNGNHIRFCAPENVTMSRIKNWEELALKGSHFAQKRGRRKRPRKAEKSREKAEKTRPGPKATKSEKKKSEEKKRKKKLQNSSTSGQTSTLKKTTAEQFRRNVWKKTKKKRRRSGILSNVAITISLYFYFKKL